MKTNKNRTREMAGLVSGKGFYIALFLCITVIGAAGWAIFSSSKSSENEIVPSAISSGKSEEQTEREFFVFSDDAVTEPIIAPSDSDEDSEVTMAEPEAPTVSASEPNIPDDTETFVEYEEPVLETLEINDSLPAVFIWPLFGNVDTPFSVSALVYDITMQDWRTHDGIDISAAVGTVVSAAADGTVESISNDDMYGTTVTISHGGGLKSIYSNLAAVPTVIAGDKVNIGDTIGSVGNTSLAESGMGSHLHLAFRLNGMPVDPSDYLPKT